MTIIIFYSIGKKVCIEQINKLPCIKKDLNAKQFEIQKH